MTRTAFKAMQDTYIESIATTAGVSRENVKIVSVEEVSTQSSRNHHTDRLLLAISIHIQTSVLLPMGQQARLSDQTVLNRNLNKNGLPSGSIVVQYMYTSAANTTTTPRPQAVLSAASTSTPSNVPQLCIILCIFRFHLSRTLL